MHTRTSAHTMAWLSCEEEQWALPLWTLAAAVCLSPVRSPPFFSCSFQCALFFSAEFISRSPDLTRPPLCPCAAPSCFSCSFCIVFTSLSLVQNTDFGFFEVPSCKEIGWMCFSYFFSRPHCHWASFVGENVFHIGVCGCEEKKEEDAE